MTDAEPEITIVDNPAASRYELRVDGVLAALTNYRLGPSRIVFTHTETEDGYTHHGLAARLAQAVLDDARARGLEVVAKCPYVAAYVAEHPEYQDLLA